jgi:hypothetical protein
VIKECKSVKEFKFSILRMGQKKKVLHMGLSDCYSFVESVGKNCDQKEWKEF